MDNSGGRVKGEDLVDVSKDKQLDSNSNLKCSFPGGSGKNSPWVISPVNKVACNAGGSLK